MTVFKTASGRWRAQHNRVSLGTFDTNREAKKAVADHVAAGAPKRSAMTIREFREVWLAKKGTEVRESTARHYRATTSRFVEAHGDRRITEWTALDAATWHADHHWQTTELKSMFRAAVDLGVIDKDPWQTFKKRRTKRQLPSGWITLDQVNKLAAAARTVGGTNTAQPGLGDLMASMILTSAWTGIRPGELFGLRPGDIDWSNGDLHIRRSVEGKSGAIDLTKSGEERTIVIPPPALDAIRAAEPARAFLWDTDPAPLFPNRDGDHWRGSSWAYWWKSIRAKAGRDTMDFYELRHHAATQLLEAGVAPEDVGYQLGHRDGGKLVIQVYGHPDERFTRDRIRRAMADLHATRSTPQSTPGTRSTQ